MESHCTLTDMAPLIDRELSCCQLDAGLLSISSRPLTGPSPVQTRFPLIPPVVPLTGRRLSGGNKQVKY